MTDSELAYLLLNLRAESKEAEWFEFKRNNPSADTIGENISALSNAAALHSKDRAWIVWGVDDESHEVVGTSFNPFTAKYGNEELISWLSHYLSPTLDFRFYSIKQDDNTVIFLEIPASQHVPTLWRDVSRIRIGSYTKKLSEHPEKERALWLLLSQLPFEQRIAKQSISADEVLSLLDFDSYFRLTHQALPSNTQGILLRLATENMIVERNGQWSITNFGAILFAIKLSDFHSLARKAVRVIDYSQGGRAAGGQEEVENSGYATSFERIVAYISSRLPKNEHIADALRIETQVYPSIALRELVANAVIHQDLNSTGDSPLVEIFPDRLEITNPGRPLIDTLRFADEPPQSRNESLAKFMRRVGVCEERGSGIDKVLQSVELYQLPAPKFDVTQNHTRVSLFSHRSFLQMSSPDRIRSCYWHACLLQVTGEQMSNETLRRRLLLSDDRYSQASKVIADARQVGLIKPYDPEKLSPKHVRYVPYWA